MTHHGAALARESGDASLPGAVVSGRFERLSERSRVLCRYALRLTGSPESMQEEDLRPLRDAGLGDRAIVDANQVVAYFNYVNRIAHGLGVALESEWGEHPRPRGPYPLRGANRPFPVVDPSAVSWITAGQMREVDQGMIHDFGISLLQMMEHAGRGLAEVTRVLLGGRLDGKRVTVLAGTGGNAGGGWPLRGTWRTWEPRSRFASPRPPIG